MNTSIDHTRAAAIGAALGAIPEHVYEAIDRGEPEWPILAHLRSLPAPYNTLTSLALSLSDFQLGPGGAHEYWRSVGQELVRHGQVNSPTALSTTTKV